MTRSSFPDNFLAHCRRLVLQTTGFDLHSHLDAEDQQRRAAQALCVAAPLLLDEIDHLRQSLERAWQERDALDIQISALQS